MDTAYSEILSYLQAQHPVLIPLFQAVPQVDYQNIRKPIYLALLGAILGQKISFKQARELRKQLYEALSAQNVDLTLNPTPSQINYFLSSPASDFLSMQPKQIIINLQHYLYARPDFDFNTQFDQLSEVVGIGVWTINTAKLTALEGLIINQDQLLITLDAPNVFANLFPANDLFILKRLSKLYNQNLTHTQVSAIAESWTPYRGIVTWHLWRWFDN